MDYVIFAACVGVAVIIESARDFCVKELAKQKGKATDFETVPVANSGAGKTKND